MNDEVRKVLSARINDIAAERAVLEEKHGQVWNTLELQEDFVVIGFLAPFVQVRRKSDGVQGTLMFQHAPRFYFSWTAE